MCDSLQSLVKTGFPSAVRETPLGFATVSPSAGKLRFPSPACVCVCVRDTLLGKYLHHVCISIMYVFSVCMFARSQLLLPLKPPRLGADPKLQHRHCPWPWPTRPNSRHSVRHLLTTCLHHHRNHHRFLARSPLSLSRPRHGRGVCTHRVNGHTCNLTCIH